ncbi:hypothetical protein M0R45_031592 [Rubus argutus]|uniref:SKP1 component POZ domain-containing protein n=1 Tax=Rubus argutus TaxID=59490 RepID=A0AAW1WIP9_RUBAR
MVEDGFSDNAIPLPKVTSSILGKLLEYCKKHLEDKEGDPGDSNNLSIKGLLDLTCQMTGKHDQGKDS